MSLHHDIHRQLTVALKAKDSLKAEVVRAALTAFTNESIRVGAGPQGELSDEQATAVIRRLIKQREEAAEQYFRGGRPDLKEKEREEQAILETFVPPLMTQGNVLEFVVNKKKELGIEDHLQKGLLMGAVMKDLRGKADGKVVKKVIDEILG